MDELQAWEASLPPHEEIAPMAKIDTSTALLPCPFCGGDLPYTDEESCRIFGKRTGHSFAVACSNCEVSAPGERTMKESIAAWNRRAIPAAQVTVKPLEWFEVTDRDDEDFGKHVAVDTNIHVRYKVYKVYGGGWRLCGSVPFGQPIRPTIEAAKAAAQADYEARIRSALTVTPHDPAKVQALVEAGERMTGPLWRLILADEHCLKSPCDMPTCECRQKFDRIAGPWTAALAAMKEG